MDLQDLSRHAMFAGDWWPAQTNFMMIFFEYDQSLIEIRDFFFSNLQTRKNKGKTPINITDITYNTLV
jgi:hypothetical protein